MSKSSSSVVIGAPLSSRSSNVPAPAVSVRKDRALRQFEQVFFQINSGLPTKMLVPHSLTPAALKRILTVRTLNHSRDLMATDETGGVLLTKVEDLLNWGRKNSTWYLLFGIACCAIELMQTGGP